MPPPAGPGTSTVTVPSRSVRATSMRRRSSSASTSGWGCPWRLSSPTPMSPTWAPTASRNAGSVVAPPWWGTVNASARSRSGASSRSAWAASSASPVSSTRRSSHVTRSTMELSFSSLPEKRYGRPGGGPSTSISRSPTTVPCPATGARTGTSASAAVVSISSTASRWFGIGRYHSAPTSTLRSTSAMPPTWSRCGWVTTATSSAGRPWDRSQRLAAASSPASTSSRAAGDSTRKASP